MIEKYFAVTYTELNFVRTTNSVLQTLGFTKDNSIAIVGICRDEISQTFAQIINDHWGLAFNMSGLGAMFIGGKMALTAAIHHAPENFDKSRYIIYAFPHIAIGSNGELGLCNRKGIKTSSACGALVSLHKEMTNKKLIYLFEKDDIEMSILKQKMLLHTPYGEVPDLLAFTKIALKVIQKDIEEAISQLVDTNKADYALLTGIQIHGPDGINYISPDSCYSVINGIKQDFYFDKT